MCGIAGFIGRHPSRAVIVEMMTERLTHRGPDGSGFFHDEGASLGHRRLSIIDLEGGAQPIGNESGEIQLVCNGEIYNSPTLRKTLTRRGHRFSTRTDVEVILHAYEEYGVDCVRRLRGMFAFAVWDSRNATLFLARDHMGQKPLFFAELPNGILFASEVKAILASGLVGRDIDLEALWHFISLRYLPDQYSLFKRVRKVPAATTLTWHGGRKVTSVYWIPDFTGKVTADEGVIVEELDRYLQTTVSAHMLSDVPVGSFVSGGIDSSTVAALMAQQTSQPIPAFSIGVEDEGFDELPYARLVTERYAMDAHERVVKADLVHLIPTMIHHMDEPADPFGVGVYFASELASSVVKVVLSGDGGDESFAGYDRYVGQMLAEYYARLPEWMRALVMKPLSSLIPETFAYNSLAQRIRWLNELSSHAAGKRYAHSLCFLRFMPHAKEALFTPRARADVADDDSIAKILRYYDAENVEDPVDRMLFTDLMTRMPDHLLAIGDRMSMAHSLEIRPVLVDREIIEFAASIPARLKLKLTQLKPLLRQVARRHLPQQLTHRKKQGFAFPIARWLRTDLSRFTEQLFAESRFASAGIFDQDYMVNLFHEHSSGRTDHNYRLWILINLEFWYRIYFDEMSLDSLHEYTDRLMAS